MEKFSESGELVLDAIAGTPFTGKASVLLDNHGRYIGCEKDICCVENSMTGLVEVLT